MDKLISGIRVVSALVVTHVIAGLVQMTGIVITDETSQVIQNAFSTLIFFAYYVGARALGERFPWANYLLVVPKSPILVDPQNREAAERYIRSYR